MNASEILSSSMFSRLRSKAINIARDPRLFSNILYQVGEKLSSKEINLTTGNDFLEEMRTVLRMLKAYLRQEYTSIPWKSLLLLIAGCIYFVMPLDAIPDFIPISGFLDDVSLIFWIFGSLQKDIDQFKSWEISQVQNDQESVF